MKFKDVFFRRTEELSDPLTTAHPARLKLKGKIYNPESVCTLITLYLVF